MVVQTVVWTVISVICYTKSEGDSMYLAFSFLGVL